MYLMYVAESGDTGLSPSSPTRYFALSGLVVHESRWRDFLNQLIAFRKTLRSIYGLPVRAEIHAAVFIGRRVPGVGGVLLKWHDRLAILRNTLDELQKMNFISITNVIADKTGKPAGYDVFAAAWTTLFQRFENTMIHGNYPGGHRDDYGLVITDATAGTKLARMVRAWRCTITSRMMRAFGSGPRNIPIKRVIEDSYGKSSAATLPIEACDVAVYFLHPPGPDRPFAVQETVGRLDTVPATDRAGQRSIGRSREAPQQRTNRPSLHGLPALIAQQLPCDRNCRCDRRLLRREDFAVNPAIQQPADRDGRQRVGKGRRRSSPACKSIRHVGENRHRLRLAAASSNPSDPSAARFFPRRDELGHVEFRFSFLRHRPVKRGGVPMSSAS